MHRNPTGSLIMTGLAFLFAGSRVRAEIYSFANATPEVTAPQPRETPPPEIPAEINDQDKVGLAVVEQTIDTNGAVIRSDVVAQTHPKCGEAALKAARNWKYEPATKDDQPVIFRELAPVTFAREKNEKLQERLAAGEAVLLGFPAKPPAQIEEKFRYDFLPEPVATPAPVYPWQQWMEGKTGSATVGYALDDKGQVVEAQVIEATEPAFGRALVAAVESWRFNPAKKKDGTPVMAIARLKFDFNLYVPPDAPEVALRNQLASATASESAGAAGDHNENEFSAKTLDAPLRPSHREPPSYPLACLKEAPGGGQAVVECMIDQNGWVRLPRVVSASREEFGWAAAASAARWRFEPPKRHGEPAVVRVRVPFEFKPIPAPQPPQRG